MSNITMSYILIASIVLLSANSCITYTAGEAVQMELPCIDDDLIIRYTVEVNGKQKPAFTVSYDAHNKQPIWVAYDLSDVDLLGENSRKGRNFKKDTQVSVPQADNNDYKNSGWTRGHLAPAADFKWSAEAMDYTFYFTNICPQIEYFNQTSWERLERRVRVWAKKFGIIYIVTGPIIGDAVNGRIGLNQITIPDAFFKAVLAKDGESYQAIGFIMENSSAQQPYTSCCVPVNDIERITGLDLFHNLDDTYEESIESTYNARFWGI